MSKPLHESLDELDRAVANLKAVLWEERYYLLGVVGIIWLGCVLWAFALYA